MHDRALEVEIAQDGPIPLDLALCCREGELMVLTGPSGAGKSTVLRTIAGLYRPTTARIVCNGEVWLDTKRGINRPPHERRVGLVFQSYVLFPHMSARDNVTVAMGNRSHDERRRAADVLLARVHLAGLESRKPASLSGGQQQRVALARALAREPQVLLLDEPLSAVDRRTRRLLLADVVDVRPTVRAPIILVTHELDGVTEFADTLVVLDCGRVLQQGAPRAVMEAPQTQRVRDLLDLPEE